jgi:uncharacterized phage protein (TIGR01671 family)
MREIKFRVFDYGSNKMYPSCYESIKGINFGMYGEVSEVIISKYSPKGYCEFETLTEFEILSFTGLKDKTGKEVFEGDLLKYKGGIGEVVYQGSGYFIKNSETQEAILGLRQCIEVQYGKVIGNKFENKELLKEKEK